MIVNNIKLFILSIVFTIFISTTAYAICVESGSTWTCSSIAYAEALIEGPNIASGDTVNIAAGSFPAASINIPNGIHISIIGAGMTNGTTMNGGSIDMNQTASRISGFKFNDVWIRPEGTHLNNPTGAPWEIDHNWFVGSIAGATGISTDCSYCQNTPPATPFGLIHSNILDGGRIISQGGPTWADDQWMLPVELGGGNRNAVYVEDNEYDRPWATPGNAIDGNYGGSYVFRFNNVSGNYLEAHSVQGYNRAIRRWEIYGNTLIREGTYWIRGMRLKGGTGVIFDNEMLGNWGSWIAMNNKRSLEPDGADGLCDGVSANNWDSLDLSNGWMCRDQPGTGPDTVLFPKTGGTNTQTRVPAYLWSNTRDYGGTTIQVEITDNSQDHIVVNRDYFEDTTSNGVRVGLYGDMPATCTTYQGYWATDRGGNWNTKTAAVNDGKLYRCESNQWVSYYTPYTYPHPLRSDASDPGDITNPTGTITAPADCTSMNPCSYDNGSTSTVTVSGVADDNVDVAHVEWEVSISNTFGTATGTNVWSADIGLIEGDNVITIIIYDTSENYTEYEITVSYADEVAVLLEPIRSRNMSGAMNN